MAKPKTKSDAAPPRGQGTPSSSPSSLPALPDGPHDLASLEKALGKPAEDVRRLLLRNHKEQAFYEWGVQADTANILADVPRFVSSSLRILAALDPGRRELVLLPPSIFAVLAGEARTLEAMHRDHQAVAGSEAGGKTDREATLKRLSGEGVALRNRVVAGLRSALGDERVEPARKAASDASSPGALVTGMDAVAKLIEDTIDKGSQEDRTALISFQCGMTRAAELRKKAAEISEASKVTAAVGKRVSKRALDIQDGRALVLIDMVYRAFRLARRSDKSLLLPELNRLGSLFSAGGGASVAKEEPAPTEDGAATGGAPK
jgi:predicted nucleic acid-binding Zn ribbon protein